MKTDQKLEKLIDEYISTYNALAEEYEKRTKALFSVTQNAVNAMSNYVRPKGKILDIGCGVGLAASFFSYKGFEVTCIDISPKMISFAKKRNPSATFIQGDFLTTNFDSLFDGVFAFSFIHLFPKDVALRILQKIHQTLDYGGIAHIDSTKSKNSKEGWEVKKDYKGKYKRYRKHWTETELRDALIQSGFEIIDLKDYTDPFGKNWIDFIVRKSGNIDN
ncbi:MAG: class I SAM-dependent methyltransferase [bacterium]|nr:class I SAM-dependent methyltransferase [bacterium]